MFSIVLEIQYPSEIERERGAEQLLLLCKTHRAHQIFYPPPSSDILQDYGEEQLLWNWRKKEEFLPIGHFSATLKIVL